MSSIQQFAKVSLLIAGFIGTANIFAQSSQSVDLLQSQILSLPDGQSTFRKAVSIDGSQAIVLGTTDALIYENDTGSWILAATLPLDTFANGSATTVDISGNYAVVGNESANRDGSSRGAVLVFEKREGSWIEVSHILASDRASTSFHFGSAVAIDGDTLVVGDYTRQDTRLELDSSSVGAVDVYERLSGAWTYVRTLRAVGDTSRFGQALAMSGNTIAVGAPWEGQLSAGAVHVFDRDGGSWNQADILVASDADDFDRFGSSVSIDNDLILVGAADKDHSDDQSNEKSNAGAAYLFERSEQNIWSQQAKLLSGSITAFQNFGESVAVSEETAVIGTNDGNAYVFQSENGNWTQKFELLRNSVATGVLQNYPVAISGVNVFIGSRGQELVYHYELSQPGECIDSSGDGFGWDGTRTCLVSNTPSSLVVTAGCVDSDGDGWGWNGSTSCLVEVVESCIDSDGDGWGWNGSTSCLVEAVEPCIDSDGDGWGWDGAMSCRI